MNRGVGETRPPTTTDATPVTRDFVAGGSKRPVIIPDDPVRVRLSGSGGQGVILAGVLLAEAGMLDGLNVTHTQSYGPAARLGAAKSDVVLSSFEITSPEVVVPDIALCLSTEAYARYREPLAEGGLLVVDDRLRAGVDIGDALALPFGRSAREVGGEIATNVLALGAIIALSGIVSAEAMRKALRERIRPELLELNRRALEAGLSLGKRVRETMLITRAGAAS
jgi:2-oxoglutarate ferredoxin oxidoreductase subunit gamma